MEHASSQSYNGREEVSVMTGLLQTTYTAGDVAIYVKRQFGDESGVQITDADIYRWIDSAQLEITARIAPVKGKATTSLVAGQRDYQLSGLAIHQIESIHIDGTRIENMPFQEAEQKILHENLNGFEQTRPAFWYEWAGTISFYPTPNESLTDGIEVFYTRMPSRVTSPTATLTVPDKFYEAVCAWVLSKAYELDEEFNQSQTQRTFFEQKLMGQNGEELESAHATYSTITYIED